MLTRQEKLKRTKEYNKNYRKENAEKIAKNKKMKRLENIEEYKLNWKEYYHKNKEKISQGRSKERRIDQNILK